MKVDPGLLVIEAQATSFLDRKRITVAIDPEGSPTDIDISLVAAEGIVIYDANFPFSFEESTRATIHIGRHPPVPITVEFTVPDGQRGSAEITVAYTDPPTPLSLSVKDVTFTREMVLKTSLRLDG